MAAEPGQFWLIHMCLSFQATSQLAFSEAYLDLAPILHILSQSLWLHLCNFYAVSRKHYFHCLWLFSSFCPLFCDDPWALEGGSVMRKSHEEVSKSFSSTHWPVGVFVCVDHHLLQEVSSLSGWLRLLLWDSNLRYSEDILRLSGACWPVHLAKQRASVSRRGSASKK